MRTSIGCCRRMSTTSRRRSRAGPCGAKYALLTLAQFERLVERHAAVLFLGTLCTADSRALGARRGAGTGGAGAATAVRTRRETRPLLPRRLPAAPYGRGRSTRRTAPSCAPRRRNEASRCTRRLPSATTRSRRSCSAGRLHCRARPKHGGGRNGSGGGGGSWARRSVLRLIKSAFTFEDGATYLAWKIKRHSGVSFELTPWQKRHPILASGTLFWRIYRAGGFR